MNSRKKTMVIVGTSPKDRVVGPLPNGRTPWLIHGGGSNHLLPSFDDRPVQPPREKYALST